MNRIPNSQLIEKDIPSRRAGLSKIETFALTYNGYAQWGSFKKCREVAKQGINLYKENKELNQSLTNLRTCLFFEARRWKHFEKAPNKKRVDYIHALVEAIRTRVAAKELS